MPKKILLKDEKTGRTVSAPIYSPTLGKDVIDVRDIPRTLGYFAYDPSFGATVSCDSAITFVDGIKGELLYRGYPIEKLVVFCDFYDVSFLVFYGELPTRTQKTEFLNDIANAPSVSEGMTSVLKGLPKKAHPMAKLCTCMAAMSGFHQENFLLGKNRHKLFYTLLKQVPLLCAMIYRHGEGVSYRSLTSQHDKGFSENFLSLCFDEPPEQDFIEAFEQFLILHADHEQNASTSTVRLAGSSLAHPYACLAGGVASLWGSSHGGANEAVVTMLENIQNIQDCIKQAKDKKNPFRLMGFGHRVYKNFDPRSQILQKFCRTILGKLDKKGIQLFQTAAALEKAALQDEYFIDRKLYPNVDFYSGVILRAIGFDKSFFTVLFALARSVGWFSHYHEMLETPALKIGRPRQLYTGNTRRSL